LGYILGRRFIELVVLSDIAISTVEQFHVLVKLVLEQRLSQRFLHLALAGMGVLPAVEPDVAYDLINVVDHSLDHDRGVAILCFLEEFGEGGLTSFLLLDWWSGLRAITF
jgi:hypothetical protein